MSEKCRKADSLIEIVSREELNKAFANINFGKTKRHIIKYGLLNCASGYSQGYTATLILTELGLITSNYNITKKGKRYLYLAFKGNSTV